LTQFQEIDTVAPASEAPILFHTICFDCTMINKIIQSLFFLFLSFVCAETFSPLQMAEISLNDGKLEMAVKWSKEAIALSPNTTRPIELLVTALAWSSNYDDAEILIMNALESTSTIPTHLCLHRELGNLINYYYPQPHSTNVLSRIQHQYNLYLNSVESKQIVVPLEHVIGVHNDMALLLQSQGQIANAVSHFQRALDLDTDTTNYKILTNYGLLLSKLDSTKIKQSIDMQRKAVSICKSLSITSLHAKNDLPRLLLNLGSVLSSHYESNDAIKREAIDLWMEALKLDPSLSLASDAIGNQYAGMGNIKLAKQYYQDGITSARNQGDAHMEISLQIKLLTLLPRVYDSTDEVLRWHWKYMANLQYLLSSTKKIHISKNDPGRAVLSMGYYLVYQGINNRIPRELMANVYRRYLPSLVLDAKYEMNQDITFSTTATIRVGFFSEYLYEHSTTKLISNVIQELARRNNNIEIYLIIPSYMKRDDMTNIIFDSVSGTHNVNGYNIYDNIIFIPGIQDLSTTRHQIQKLNLDILVFVEIGMGMCSYFLGFSAKTLAKRSIMFWGHGVTSGIQNGIDYFVSSKLFHAGEEGGYNYLQESYTEKLYLHESLTVAFQAPPKELPTMNLRRLIGIEVGEPHYYLAPTSLYKFHPLMDRPLSEILRRDPLAIIILVGGASKRWSDQIVRRIHRQLPEENNARQRIVVVSAMPRTEYLSFLKNGHVVILPFPTTSSVTVFETISVATPFVSFAGSAKYLLQHYAPGILKAMKVDQSCCIATDEDDYIEKALQFGTNSTWRKNISNQFKKGSEILFGSDLKNSVISEWEKMLRKVLAVDRPGK
jgi:tetratricopeptide (TPR) repeat protein